MVTTVIKDNAFIFLKPTLEEVYIELNNPQIADIFRYDFISLDPTETYRQVSNSAVDINLGQDYVVELVTACRTVLADVTENVFITEFQHRTTGNTNIYFEMINLPNQYGKTVHLKFTCPILNSETVFYSNPFHITSSPKDTTRIDYWDYELYDGFDFQTTQAKLSIRVKGHFTKLQPATERQSYTQVSNISGFGTVIRNKATKVLQRLFTVEYESNHEVKCLESISCIGVIYINGIRVTNFVPTNDNILGSSNFMAASWIANTDETEIYTDEYQIKNPFALNSISPTGSYTLDSLPDDLVGRFTSNIVKGTGNLTIYNSLGVAVAIYDESVINVSGSQFSVNISGDITVNDNYYVNFDSGLFVSIFSQNISLTNTTGWTFEVHAGEFDNTEFSNEFLLN